MMKRKLVRAPKGAFLFIALAGIILEGITYY